LVVSYPKDKGLEALVFRATLFCIGFILLSALICGWAIANGVWKEFVYWAFLHNLEYAGSATNVSFLERLWVQVPFMVKSNPFLWIGALAGCVMLVNGHRSKGWFAVGFLLSSLIAAFHSPALYRHYFALACPALALAAGAGVSSTMVWWENRRSLRPLVLLGIVLLIVGIPLAQYRGYYYSYSPIRISRMMFGSNPFPEAATAADYLKEHTNADDSILVLGSEPQLLVLADRPSASSHPFYYPVVGHYRRSREFQDQVIQDLRKRHPEYIVVVQNAQSWMADPHVSRSLLNRIYESLASTYRLDALVISGDAFVTLVDCKTEAAACISAVAPGKGGAGQPPPGMVLYRKDSASR